MSDEETQKTIQFILDTQAKGEAHLDRLERVLKLLVRAGRRERSDLRQKLAALIDVQTQSDDRFQEFLESSEEKFNALVSSQLRTDEAMAKMADAIAHTVRRVDDLERPQQ